MNTPDQTNSSTKRRNFLAKIFGSNFLLISIIVHLLFGAVATYLIVQRVQAKRKLTFQGGPPSTNPSKRALEHQVSMAKKKSGGAPPQAKRIVSAGLAKISLPDMPSLPTTNSSVSSTMSGMGGAGFGQGMGFGSGTGGGMGGGGGGGGMNMFGFHNSNGGGLRGEFYDLKQTSARQPTGVDIPRYGQILADFVRQNWPEGGFHDYYKSPKFLYAPQILIPDIDAALAPKAFDVQREVQPQRWVVLYRGKVTAPDSGTYHFVGGADDILFVKFNGKTVLNACWSQAGYLGGDAMDQALGIRTEARYDYHWPTPDTPPFAKGEGFQVEAGQTYPIEILIGEWPGGRSHFVLLIEKDGAAYDSIGSVPILPVFRMGSAGTTAEAHVPRHRDDGLIWRAQGEGEASLLNSLK